MNTRSPSDVVPGTGGERWELYRALIKAAQDPSNALVKREINVVAGFMLLTSSNPNTLNVSWPIGLSKNRTPDKTGGVA